MASRVTISRPDDKWSSALSSVLLWCNAVAPRRSIWLGISVAGWVAACAGGDSPADLGAPSAVHLDVPPRASASAARAPAAPITCKDPPCPLFDWMATHMEPALEAGDLAALEAQFAELPAMAPPPRDYPNWVSIARDGASAAQAGEGDAARAACRSCHEQYVDRYARELRKRRI